MRVVVAEDSALLRDGLVHLLSRRGHQVVAAVENAKRLLAAVADLAPNIAVVDVRMPPTHTDEGLRAALALRRDHPAVAVLMLSQFVEPHSAAQLLSGPCAGLGYLLKDRLVDVDEFCDAVARVATGGTVFDPEVVSQIIRASRHTSTLDTLTDRERQVLELLAQGRSNAGIAAALHLSYASVEKHITNIFTKLDLPPSNTGHRRVLAALRFLRS